MRRFAFYALVALLAFGIGSLLLSSCVVAQNKTIKEDVLQENKGDFLKEKDFKEILAKAKEKLKNKIYRLTETKENFSDREAKAETVKTNVFETIPPDKWRRIEEIKSPTVNSKIERIWDGKNLYEKKNNGEWKKFDGGGNSSGGDFATGRVKTTYKFVEKTTLDNVAANVYEVETNRIANKISQTSRFEVHYVEKTKYWISDDGYFLKMIKESEAIGAKWLNRDVEIYEYDQNIRIEAPVK